MYLLREYEACSYNSRIFLPKEIKYNTDISVREEITPAMEAAAGFG